MIFQPPPDSAEVVVLKQNLPRIGFIGAGTVATTLACALHGKGYPVVAVASRTYSSSQKIAVLVQGCHPYQNKQHVVDNSDLIFITTPDDVISQVAGELTLQSGKYIVHCSGADTSALLQKASCDGAVTGVIHPLQTFAGLKQVKNSLRGITFSVEAREPLLSILKIMGVALGGKCMVLAPEDRAIYHTSAVMVSNYLVTLVKLAADLWSDFGITREDAVRALAPLIQGTLNNIETVGLPGCLSGPISRGDTGTLKKHLAALSTNHTGILSTYVNLGLQTIPVALEKAKIDSSRAQEIAASLKNSAKEVSCI